MTDFGRIAKITAGIAGLSFLGYCVYFDRKRRSDPLFKQKLKESECLICVLTRVPRWATLYMLRGYEEVLN